ncbi:MAG: VCBS repeat-containing protein, partial [Gemmatimonadota bacterium]
MASAMKIFNERNRGKSFSLLTALIIVTSLCFGTGSFASDHSASHRMWEVPIVAPKKICTFQDGHQCTLSVVPSELPFKPSATRQAPSSIPPVTQNEKQLFLDETEFRLPALIDFSTDIELGDVDGDDDLDILMANTDGQQNRLYINDGFGIFNDETKNRLPRDDDFSLGVEFGDVDNDGDFDIFVANNFAFQVPDCEILSGHNRLLINDGTGVFYDETELRLPQFIAASTDAKCVDVDGDDDLDIIVMNSIRPGSCFFVAGGQGTLLINDGSGFFVDETGVRMPLGFYSDVGFDVGDIDGDSDVDIVVANPYGHNRILVNDGSGRFTDQSHERLSHRGNSTRGVIFFDADNDDDLDIFWASDSTSVWPGRDGSQNFLLINDGAGMFEDETDVRLPLVQDVSMGGADFGDVDGDGDLDIIVANNKFMSEGRQNHLLVNTGSGFYAEEVANHLPAIKDVSAAVKLGDVNGDGVLDVVIANYGEQNVLFVGNSEPKGGPVEPEVLRGDADGDGEIDVTDVLLLVNHILGHVLLDEETMDRADCNDDGQVDILDAIGIV